MTDDRPRRPPRTISRRGLLGGGAAALGGGLAATVLSRAGGEAHPAPGKVSLTQHLRVLSPAHAAVAGAMADRAFPADAQSPGATAIGVVAYLDGQLAGDWGAGARLYRHGPFVEPSDSGHGYQLPLNPRELYQHVLPRIETYVADRYGGRRLPELAPADQDAVMTALEAGDVDLGLADGSNGFTSATFFTMFLANVAEGLFADPMYGGNRDVEGWRWIDYPGDPMAYGDPYFGFFSSWHVSYHVEPKGMSPMDEPI
jgi:gluconate 2-dehydrogenase gamma chain